MAHPASSFDKAIRIISPGGCHQCHGDSKHPYEVQVSSIEATEDSWIVHGKGKLVHISKHCPMCGLMYCAVMRTISIQCEPFQCPRCGEREHLEYSVQKINAEDASFEFVAEIRCAKCRNKKSLKKVVKQILEVLKIEIGPSGITVKNA